MNITVHLDNSATYSPSRTALTTAEKLFVKIVLAYHMAVYDTTFFLPEYEIYIVIDERIGRKWTTICDTVNHQSYALQHQSTRVGMHSWWKGLSGHEKAEILSYNPETN